MPLSIKLNQRDRKLLAALQISRAEADRSAIRGIDNKRIAREGKTERRERDEHGRGRYCRKVCFRSGLSDVVQHREVWKWVSALRSDVNCFSRKSSIARHLISFMRYRSLRIAFPIVRTLNPPYFHVNILSRSAT